MKLLEPPRDRHQRLEALAILAAALEAVDPYQAVLRHLQRAGDRLTIGSESIDLGDVDRVIVVGGGKAGAPMAAAVEDILGDRITAGWVNVKFGHAGPTRLVRVHEAGHPIPDEAGLAGTRAITAMLQGLTPRDLVMCLLSGGGSALLTQPRAGVSLIDLQLTTTLLLRAGAAIDELNVVRKQLDEIKGGGLARLAAPAHLVTLVLSDVIGDRLDVIASGPTTTSTSTAADARAILDRYGLWQALPESVARSLDEKSADATATRASASAIGTTVIVGSNRLAVEAALGAAREGGFATLDLGSYLQGEAREVGRVLGGVARSIATEGRPLSPPACVIGGGETTVTVRGEGRGGRNQELALGAALEVAGLGSVVVASLGTDGSDGPTDAAGAIVDGTTLHRARAAGLDPHLSLAQNDVYAFFEPLGDLLRTGPTQTNVNDVMLALVFASDGT